MWDRESSQEWIQIVPPGWVEDGTAFDEMGQSAGRWSLGDKTRSPVLDVLSLICLLAIQDTSLRRMRYFWKLAKTINDILKDILLGD